MRSLSANALASALAPETAKVWLVLLTITHSSLSSPIRVVNNTENVTSAGNLFVAMGFDIELPGEDPDGPISARISIDNVDRMIVNAIRSIDSPPMAMLQVVLADSPSTVEVQFEGLSIRDVGYDAGSVKAELRFEEIFTEPVSEAISPTLFPGLG